MNDAVMADSSDWPLPSESRRVRAFLYLAEGTAVGAGLVLFLISIFDVVLADIGTGPFDPAVSVAGGFFVLLCLFLLLRGIVLAKLGHRYYRANPPEYQDWTETRRWVLVAAVALPVGGALLGVATVLWRWRSIVFVQAADFLLLGTILVAFCLHLYVFQRIGVKVV